MLWRRYATEEPEELDLDVYAKKAAEAVAWRARFRGVSL